jgi:curved DNA-binding protein CbpA
MSADRLDLLDYYTLLGVAEDANAHQIKLAFRTFARKYHPDRHAAGPPERIARATQIYQRGSEAMQVLTDPTLRRGYDAAHARGALRLTPEERDRIKRGRG